MDLLIIFIVIILIGIFAKNPNKGKDNRNDLPPHTGI